MPYIDKSQAFRGDKHTFFEQIAQFDNEADLKIRYSQKREFARNSSNAKDFGFLSNNKRLIESEFDTLIKVIQQDDENFLWYCYYCCCMLYKFYLGYDNPVAAKDYLKTIKTIETLLNNEKVLDKEESRAFMEFLAVKLKKDLWFIISSPKRLTHLRTILEQLNNYRLYWTFSRLTVTNALRAGVEFGIIEKLSALLNKSINVEKAIYHMEKLNQTCYFLSVALFAAHLGINLSIAAKHIFFPIYDRKELSVFKRIALEIKFKDSDLMNAFAWIIANTLTNFPNYIPLSAMTTNTIVSAFLLFDLLNVMWKEKRTKRDHLTDLAKFKQQLKNPDLNPAARAIIELQKEEALIVYNAKMDMYAFKKKAALFFIIGFIVAALLPLAVVGTASYALIVLGSAFYWMAQDYQVYREKKARSELAEINGEGYRRAHQEFIQARQQFVENILIKGIAPCVILLTFTICWQAAIVLTALVVAYKLISLYKQNRKQTKRLATEGMFKPKALTGRAINSDSANENLITPPDNSQEEFDNDSIPAGSIRSAP